MFCFPHPTEEWTGLLVKMRKKSPEDMAKLHQASGVTVTQDLVREGGWGQRKRWVIEMIPLLLLLKN